MIFLYILWENRLDLHVLAHTDKPIVIVQYLLVQQPYWSHLNVIFPYFHKTSCYIDSYTKFKTLNSQGYSKWLQPIKTCENCPPLIWKILNPSEQLWKSARYILRATAFSHQPVLYCSCYCFCMVNLTRHWHAHCMYFNHSHFTFSQLAPKPPQPQVSNAAQQPRLIVPALPSSIPQITGTGATGNIQFPHGVISGGVVYLPQVWELSTRCTCRSQNL